MTRLSPPNTDAGQTQGTRFCQGSQPVIGLLGGVASGKSLVALQLAEMGAWILDADRAGHDALRLPEVRGAVVERWGRGILGQDGEVDRSSLAKVVFSPSLESVKERQFLEGLTHPRIEQLLRDETKCAAASSCRAIVLDAPLLVEAGWHRFCDKLIFVDAPRQQRWERARQRGWTECELAAREGVQESLDLKRKLADVVIVNSGSPDETRSQLQRAWHYLLG